MLQNPRKTLGFKKNMVYKIPPGGGGKPYPASGLLIGKVVATEPGVEYAQLRYKPLERIKDKQLEF